MSQAPTAEEVARKRVVYDMAGTDAVAVRRDVEFRSADGGALEMDLYYPADARSDTPAPAVVLVVGYPGEGVSKILGCSIKETGSAVSWGRLIAASGMVAVTYTNRAPVGDLHALMDHVRQQAGTLGIDPGRMGIWASSGNVPLALSLLMQREQVGLRCAALCYGYMLDLDGSTAVAEGCRTFRFANPNGGRSIDDLRSDVPLFLARAGNDEITRLNESLDRFVAAALARNLPITLANHPTGPHAFDLFDDGPASREIIRQILNFLQFHLLSQVVDRAEPDSGAGAVQTGHT